MTALSIQSSSPYQAVNPLEFIKQMGSSIAKSQMFGCETESQGQVFAMACLSQRCDPLTLPQTWHVMHGRLTMRADAMLGRLSAAGGSYTVVEHSSEAAEIIVDYKGRKFRERLTWDDAKKEPFVYEGKPKEIMPMLLAGQYDKLKLSTNYATPRRRSQHLWARVCSDAVRVVAPDLVTGVYTPTEIREITGRPVSDKAVANMPGDRDAMEAAEERSAIQSEPVSGSARDADGEVVDASFTVKGGQVVTESTTLADQSAAEPPITSRNMREKIDQKEIDSLKALVVEVSQVVPEIANQVKSLFVSQGLRFADLSWQSARELREKIEMKEMEALAGLMLQRAS